MVVRKNVTACSACSNLLESYDQHVEVVLFSLSLLHITKRHGRFGLHLATSCPFHSTSVLCPFCFESTCNNIQVFHRGDDQVNTWEVLT
jgi:hypothetical protein